MSNTKYTSEKYRAFRLTYLKELKERKIAAGICIRCPAPAKPGFRYCEKHLAIDRNYKCNHYDPIKKSIKNKKAYYKKVKEGQCTSCKEDALPGHTLCKKHREQNIEKNRHSNKINRKKYLEEGRCTRCGTPLDELEKMDKKVTCVDCSSHRDKNKKY